jgi:hypothetical protein
MQRNGVGSSLRKAQHVLEETRGRLAALADQRNVTLLHGTDADVSKVDLEIEAANKLLRTHGDRVKLLEIEAEKEAAAKRAKELAALVDRVEKKLGERDAIAAELASCVAAADAALVKLFACNRLIQAGWPWEGGHVGAVLLGDAAVLGVLGNEIFRVGGRVPPGGGMPPDPRGPSYPGAKCEELQWIMMPEKTKPMVEKFAEASAAAKQIMRGERGRADGAPLPTHTTMPTVRTESEKELAALLVRQSELAMLDTAAAEAEYVKNGERIKELTP